MIVKVVVLSEVSKVEILCIFYLKSGFENTSTDTVYNSNSCTVIQACSTRMRRKGGQFCACPSGRL